VADVADDGRQKKTSRKNRLVQQHTDCKRINKPIQYDKLSKQKREIPVSGQLYQGDSLEILENWPKDFFDCCITDPPYNIARNRKGLTWAFSSHVTMQNKWDKFRPEDYETFTRKWLSEISRVTKVNGNIFVFGSYHNIYTIGSIAAQMDLRFINSIVWAKPNAQPNITCRMFTESTEQILWLCNNSSRKASKWTFNYDLMKKMNNGKQMRNFWLFPVASRRERTQGSHPSQKPIPLMERIILAATNAKDIVIDCFAGSGSTLVACNLLQRRWIGIERDKSYCNVAFQRLNQNHEAQ